METTFKIPFKSNGASGYRAFFATKSGKFKLSVIAGEYAYSEPRANVDTEQYSKVEIAIFYVDETKFDWASYSQLKEAGAFDILGTEGEYEGAENIDSPQSFVFGYINRNKVEQLYNGI